MSRWNCGLLVLIVGLWMFGRDVCGQPAFAVEVDATDLQTSITDRSVDWPTIAQWRRVVLLEDYNTRIVLLGTMLLGAAAGMVGSFTLLRKRALMGDALSHATLPGICLAFLFGVSQGGDGKSLVALLLGATLTGLLGVATILLLRNLTRLKEDTALGAVLSVYFGAGVALLGVIQQMQQGHAAGLESFVYGKTASMGVQDIRLIAGAAGCCAVASLLLFKEFKLLCFDEGFAGANGLPVLWLDLALMALVVTITIVGLQAVGLVLMVALLVIPAAAARFWTDKLWQMFTLSGALGALSGIAGAAMSALFSRLPSGAMIVLVCTAFFLISLVFGSSRGVLVRTLRRWHLNRTIDRQHLLRAIYEILEACPNRAAPPHDQDGVAIQELLAVRSWSRQRLQRALRAAQRDELVEWGHNPVRLTRRGRVEAARMTRQHRLWELYLMTHADIAPSRVDRDADAIEHVLEPEVIAELESLLDRQQAEIPGSPHALQSPAAGASRPGRGEA